MHTFRAVLIAVSLHILVSFAEAQSYTLKPSSITFPPTTIGMASQNTNLVLTNTGTSTLTVSSIAIDSPAFQLATGWAPLTLDPTQPGSYGINFAPTFAGPASGHFIITIQGLDPISVPLSGTGVITNAAVSLSTSSLTFSEAVGVTSALQTVKATNTGSDPLTVTGVTSDPTFYASGFTVPATITPGASFSFKVSQSGTVPGSQTNLLTLSYDVLPSSGVDLSGTTTPAQSLVVSSFPYLPKATVGYPFYYPLTAAGGKPPYIWRLAGGTSLPKGLTLNSDGTITGTVASTASLGTRGISVQVRDSVLASATVPMYATVSAPTGANCNNISWNIPKTTSPMIPLTDLGTGTYLGKPAGLYPNGSNVRPSAHDAAGVALAQSIQPLDAAGNPDPNGKYALLSIGMSSTSHTWNQFTIDATADPSRNSHLVIARGAQPSTGAVHFADVNDGAWGAIIDFFLPQAGLTRYQVVAAWVLAVDGFPTGSFPNDMKTLQSEYESIARNLHTHFPNIKIVYYSSKFYDGYANGLPTSSFPEPFAYESGFAVKWAIEKQINGNASLNYDPAKGTVVAPWMAWGPYDWANGMLPRSDGLIWICQDVNSDGVHPSNPLGREKEANILMNFFKSDTTATPWFLAH